MLTLTPFLKILSFLGDETKIKDRSNITEAKWGFGSVAKEPREPADFWLIPVPFTKADQAPASLSMSPCQTPAVEIMDCQEWDFVALIYLL